MSPEEKNHLYDSAALHYGIDNQLCMAMEECAELIQAINKFRRNKTGVTIANLCTEIADVEITIEQVKRMLNKDGVIENAKERKLNRFAGRIEKEITESTKNA